MIEVQNLTKQYGAKKAVDNLSFTVNDGEILGFLGPNGAGKSTTMNMLTGYISSTEGKALINGIDILDDNRIFVCRQRCYKNRRYGYTFRPYQGKKGYRLSSRNSSPLS